MIGNHYASSPAALQASFFDHLLIFIALIGGANPSVHRPHLDFPLSGD